LTSVGFVLPGYLWK